MKNLSVDSNFLTRREMSSSSIWQERQNKPSLIVYDIVERYPNVDAEFIYEVLLRRGVFKWLAVRRDLIKLKEEWKKKIRELNRKKTQQEKGYLKALEKCRAQVRDLCHSPRWRAPDFDKKSQQFLDKKEINIEFLGPIYQLEANLSTWSHDQIMCSVEEDHYADY